MKLVFIISVSVLLSICFKCSAQGYIKSEYLTSSSFKDDDGNNMGSGNMLKISGGYNIPLSMKMNEENQPTAWSLSMYGAYGVLSNRNMMEDINPEKIFNSSLNVTHIRPLSKKWRLIASLGAGIYSAPDEITEKSILVNGAAIFIYNLKNNLDLGFGVGLTNSFGVPLLMPMSLVKWKLPGNYELDVDIASGMKIAAKAKLNNSFKLSLVAMEMDGMSSVVEVDGKSMIYATSTLKSYLSPEYKIGKASTIYMGVGGTWLRSVSLNNRSFKGFSESLFNNKRKLHFNTSLYLNIGFRYGF
ncbi:DUF6268 family outer membrane beta-barrel protein [Dysgonomonas sp. 520]|uniref:DUF6268 family outer membrane beta-barrel protein n=1 Tax=Dysgonomonas sp. 520 TaxID=2302931 RepID=UPI0013D13D6F|nr:DUF6268 family outer membrane beta-barrel protein [Dysgonomonas sp. 520]NDW08486.1 hypothetical protein [Dysgonomonas sp. 520]